MIHNTDKLEKPCNSCSPEERDNCWTGPKFACKEWYKWSKSRNENNSKEDKIHVRGYYRKKKGGKRKSVFVPAYTRKKELT